MPVGDLMARITEVPRTGAGPGHDPARGRQAAMPALPRHRRRGMLILGVALTGAGTLAAAALFTSATHQVPVLVVTRDIPAGSVITAGELGTADISAGPGVATIPARQAAQVAGETAAVALPAGTLLGPADLTTATAPRPGQVLVTVTLKSWQIPASGLTPGTPVLVVATPGTAGQAASAQVAGGLGGNVTAIVYRVAAADQSGNVAVDLLTAQGHGTEIARQASTGQIALVETSRSS